MTFYNVPLGAPNASNNHLSTSTHSTKSHTDSSGDPLSHLEETKKPSSQKASARSAPMISCWGMTKKLFGLVMVATLPVESGRKMVNVMDKNLNQSDGFVGMLGNKTHSILNTDEMINDLVHNDPLIKRTEDQYAVTSNLHARITQTANSGSVVQNGEGPAKQELEQGIAQNFFDRQMLYKYQRAVMYETHLATHMTTYELEKYANQVEGLQETVTQLRIEAAQHAERIVALEGKLKAVTDDFLELLDLSKAVHDLARRACDFLLDIPFVKNIDFIETICNANDRLGEGVGKLERAHNKDNGSERQLTQEGVDAIKIDWKEDQWPRVQFWIEKLHEISANIDEHPDFVSPGLPTPEEGWPDYGNGEGAEISLDIYRGKMIEEIYHLSNFTEVIEHTRESSNTLAATYVNRVDALLHNESISLYEQLTGGSVEQTNAQERMNQLKTQLRGATEATLKDINQILGDVAEQLNSNSSSINQKVYLYCTLIAIGSLFAIIQATRACSKNNAPLICANSPFNDRYTDKDNPGLEVNKLIAKKLMRSDSDELQKYFSKERIIPEDDQSDADSVGDNDTATDTIHLKPGTRGKVGAKSAIFGFPEFLMTSGLFALVLSSLAARAMDANFNILEQGDRDLNAKLKAHGDDTRQIISELYAENDKLAQATQSLQTDLLSMEEKYIAHQEQLAGKIEQLNTDFESEFKGEYRWLEGSLDDSLLAQAIADRSKNTELEAQFAAVDMTNINNWSTDSLLSNATAFPSGEGTQIPGTNWKQPPLGNNATITNGAQTPHDKAQAHYAEGSTRLDGKLDGLDAKVADSLLYDALLVAGVFTLFILRKVDSQTIHPQTHANNDYVDRIRSCEERIIPCISEKQETRDLADLLSGLQLYKLRMGKSLPGFLQQPSSRSPKKDETDMV